MFNNLGFYLSSILPSISFTSHPLSPLPTPSSSLPPPVSTHYLLPSTFSPSDIQNCIYFHNNLYQAHLSLSFRHSKTCTPLFPSLHPANIFLLHIFKVKPPPIHLPLPKLIFFPFRHSKLLLSIQFPYTKHLSSGILFITPSTIDILLLHIFQAASFHLFAIY